MKASKLDEIKNELETLVEFREGTGTLKDSFFGEYQGTSVTLSYMGDYSSIWIGQMDENFKIGLSMNLMECTVEIEESKIRFHGQDFVVVVGE